MSVLEIPDYKNWLASLKTRIQSAQQRAALSVNRELVLLYWQIGRDILDRQQAQGWGAKVVTQLAKDLTLAFPDMKGFSRSNLMYMRAFHEAWPEESIVQQLVGQLPWGQNLLLLTKLKTREERQWYAAKAIEHGWSRNVMWHHISTQLQQRTGKAVTNFDKRLPSPDSELAQQTLKDPYLFDFLGVSNEAHEREIETAMTRHVTKMLMELGEGFAFVGRQVPLEVDGQGFFIDLLFYNYRLHRFLVVELKAGEFKPEHAGQLNFYVTLVDEKIKSDEDKPTLGLLLCKQQHRVVAEYALRGMTQPIGIAEYKLQLPDDVAKYLPTIKQIESELMGSAAETEADSDPYRREQK
ncbi:PDDEXK nuclease domain-containing protein [Polaromonas sp. CG_23.6]|uniref:PDDEXK nuclease domain-containing protein n=1 Tax=Polaromonas sp. CG_23.6 TaxID=2760709 RepID=UPI0024736F40|nr:PDDEXK nuclease domain-containing protein [Polaromonas sp. CG_23.6]MDH6186744.1 putative nuclease of restriction endonuclease-like (RecB) superfamily [Polaromonas sp. CG_23.6]